MGMNMDSKEERQALLAKIDELKQNSINYFDVEKEFFIIDSNNLATVRPRMYGYSVQKTGIYEDCNLTEEAVTNLDGRGCYIYVDVKDGQITIRQDFNGSYGIYLFRGCTYPRLRGDGREYFALSNSFFRLLDHVKTSYQLTLNRDYANYFLVEGLTTNSCRYTLVNEIELTDKNTCFVIDIINRKLTVHSINYNEHSCPLDSDKGISVIDNWFIWWTTFFNNICKKTDNIIVDLSGGFDTRLCLLLIMCSGIDLNKIRINSFNDGLHVHAEDYKIASSIAEYLGFRLNEDLGISKRLNYSISDIMNIEYYIKMGFHKEPYFVSGKYIDKRYHITGAGGEIVRGYQTMSKHSFCEQSFRATHAYPHNLSDQLSISIEKIINEGYNIIEKKYPVVNDNDYPHYLYQETRCRSHYGKAIASAYFSNIITLTPSFDHELLTLHLRVPSCPDNNLRMALIFVRFFPELLNFPIEGNRSFSRETVDFAHKLNNQFPIKNSNINYNTHAQVVIQQETSFDVETHDLQLERIVRYSQNNVPTFSQTTTSYMKAAFDSSSVKGLFIMFFSEVIYDYAKQYYDKQNFFPIRHCYSVLAVTRVLQEIMVSRFIHPAPLWESDRFIQDDSYEIDDDKDIQHLKLLLTARVDIKLMGQNAPDFQLLSLSDPKAEVAMPPWWQHGGMGYVVISYRGELELRLRAGSDGEVVLLLMGIDVRVPGDNTKRIPYWVDYTSLCVNGVTVFDGVHPAWHDKPYRHVFNIKTGEEIALRLTWVPHPTPEQRVK